jgi:hypothetical protein
MASAMYLAVILVKADTAIVAVTTGIIIPMIIRDPVGLEIPTVDNLNLGIIPGINPSPQITVKSPVIDAGRKVILDLTVLKMDRKCSRPKS